MAPVNEQPFLHYLFEYLGQQGCDRVILSLGYKHEVIIDWLLTQDLPFDIDFAIEQVPMGTGGGIKLAMGKALRQDVVVLNGDTMFQVDLAALMDFHSSSKSETTLALKEMKQFERYGSVKVNGDGVITAFEEKRYMEEGSINGGIYIINNEAFAERGLPDKFSFEKDYLEAFVTEERFYGQMQEGYFIDIGIPEDYRQAQEDFKQIFS
jgi:D-glycero-alpha-D-manno-heptose 1-phosphate guanylyltransferase